MRQEGEGRGERRGEGVDGSVLHQGRVFQSSGLQSTHVGSAYKCEARRAESPLRAPEGLCAHPGLCEVVLTQHAARESWGREESLEPPQL